MVSEPKVPLYKYVAITYHSLEVIVVHVNIQFDDDDHNNNDDGDGGHDDDNDDNEDENDF